MSDAEKKNKVPASPTRDEFVKTAAGVGAIVGVVLVAQGLRRVTTDAYNRFTSPKAAATSEEA